MQNIIKKNKKSLKIAGTMAIVAILSVPGMLLAATTVPYVPVNQNLDVNEMLMKVQGYFFGIIIVTCVFMILWGGFDIATAGDKEDKVTGGKDRIKYAVIGLIVAASAAAIVSVVRFVVNS